MKKMIAILVLMFCISLSFAQDNEKVKYVKKGDLVEATFYYDDGRIEQQGFFKDEKLHGIWKYYNKEGEKIAVGNYKLGKKEGRWVFIDKNIAREVDYINGRVVRVNQISNRDTAIN